jgi:NhaP-type Na+/H+ or K+/H+ antiporter
VVAVFYFAYALVSKRLRSTPITGPILFVAFGLLIGTSGLGLVTAHADSNLVAPLFEATLVLVLFTDAMAVTAHGLRRESFVPLRLLGIGLPLTIAAGIAVGVPLFGGAGIWEIAVVATVLAPTDASLGLAVVSDPRVPLLIRHSLNVESGLNDGIALPFLSIFLVAAAESEHLSGAGSVVSVFLRALVVSTVIGVAVGWLGGTLIAVSSTRGWMGDGWRQSAVIAIAFAAYGITVSIEGGSGFIAAWVAGFVTGATVGERFEGIRAFSEDLGSALTTLSYLAFGALFMGPALRESSWQTWLYAVLSLTVVRMVPVAVALIGTGLRPPTVAFVGWFGPRGLASIIFSGLVVERALPHSHAITTIVTVTVGLSVLLHGVTASIGARWYGGWYERALRADPDLREAEHVTHVVERRRV